MSRDEIRRSIHEILDSHDDALAAIRQANEHIQQAHGAFQQVLQAHDAAVVSAIEANRAALRLLNRLIDEGMDDQP